MNLGHAHQNTRTHVHSMLLTKSRTPEEQLMATILRSLPPLPQRCLHGALAQVLHAMYECGFPAHLVGT